MDEPTIACSLSARDYWEHSSVIPAGGSIGSDLATSWGLDTMWQLPRVSARPPPRHGTSVRLVLRAEPAGQGRLLVEVGERGHHKGCGHRVPQKLQLAQYQGLPDDGRHDRQVHRVADIAVYPADDQLLSWSNRRRGADALHHEPNERLHQYDRAGRKQPHARDPDWQPGPGHRLPHPPAGQPPGNEAGDDPGGQHKEDCGPDCGQRFAQVVTSSAGWFSSGSRLMGRSRIPWNGRRVSARAGYAAACAPAKSTTSRASISGWSSGTKV